MEIKGFATAVWLILDNFLAWHRLLVMMLTTPSSTGMLCTLTPPPCLLPHPSIAPAREMQCYIDAAEYLLIY